MTRRIKLSLLGIILLGLAVRLYELDTPLADWHSFRQADTASVTREYVQHGINLLEPQYHDLSNIQSGQFNPEGYRMVEFPIINAFTAGMYQLTQPMHDLPVHVFSRLISIVFSLGSLFLMFLITRRLSFKRPHVPLLSALFFAVLPFNVYYSRTILPEIPTVFFSLLTLWLALKISTDSNQSKRSIVFSSSALVLAGALALLIKPTAGFLLIPAYFILIKRHISLKNVLYVLVIAILAITPFYLWRLWIENFPEGIPANSWLLNGNGIRLRPAWFRWLFWERLTKLILGYSGILLFTLGLIQAISPLRLIFSRSSSFSSPYVKRRLGGVISDLKWWFLSKMQKFNSTASKSPPTLSPKTTPFLLIVWSFSLLTYLIIFATGNVQHDYYQILTIPFVSLILALGSAYLLKDVSKIYDVIASKAKQSPQKNKLIIVKPILFLLLYSSMLFFSWQQIKGYYHINHWAIVRAGEAVDQLTPEDALVIAPYMGDTAFLYQTNRRGWPIGFEIQDKIDKGADYYVSVNYDDETRSLMQRYPVISQTEEYVLIKLN